MSIAILPFIKFCLLSEKSATYHTDDIGGESLPSANKTTCTYTGFPVATEVEEKIRAQLFKTS